MSPIVRETACSESLEVKLECLEVLNDLFRRFAAHLSEIESHDCLNALFGELTSNRGPLFRPQVDPCR